MVIRRWRLRRAHRRLARLIWFRNTFEWYMPSHSMVTEHKIEQAQARMAALR